MGSRKIFALSMMCALAYLTYYHYRDYSSKPCLDQQMQKAPNQGYFFLFTNSYLRFRPGVNLFHFDRIVREIQWMPSPSPEFSTSSVLLPPVIEKKSGQLFMIRHDHDFFVSGIIAIPLFNNRDTLGLKIFHRPVPRPVPLLFQFLLALISCLTIIGLGRMLYHHLLTPENPVSDSLTDVLPVLLSTSFLIFIIYFFLNHEQMARTIQILSVKALPLLLGNFFLTGTVLAVFWISVKSPSGKPALLLAVFLIAFITPAFNPALCGDAPKWLASIGDKRLHGSDALASLITRLMYRLLRRIKPGITPLTVLHIQGKAIGILFLAVLARMSRTFKDFTSLSRSLFFGLALALPFSVFLFGFPEYGYQTLPFLVISFIFACAYLRDRRWQRLVLATFFLSLGATFHGSSFFSLPAILALPLIALHTKAGGKTAGLLKAYAAIFMTLFVTIAAIVGSLLACGYSLNFENINGIATESRFVLFSPVNDLMALRNKIFLEPGYMAERGWIFLVAFPVVFLFLFRKKSLRQWRHDPATMLLFLYAIGQTLISLLWDVDFGIHDFDLYAAPMTFFNLFLIRLLVMEKNGCFQAREHVPLLVLFSLASPFSLLLFSTLIK